MLASQPFAKVSRFLLTIRFARQVIIIARPSLARSCNIHFDRGFDVQIAKRGISHRSLPMFSVQDGINSFLDTQVVVVMHCNK
jgi:hypothetical protein